VVRLDVPLQALGGGPTAATGAAAAAAGPASSRKAGSAAHQQQHRGLQHLLGQRHVGGAGGDLAGSGPVGLDDLAAGLRDSIRTSFQARQAAYDTEV
jgi:hypothetical protein